MLALAVRLAVPDSFRNLVREEAGWILETNLVMRKDTWAPRSSAVRVTSAVQMPRLVPEVEKRKEVNFEGERGKWTRQRVRCEEIELGNGASGERAKRKKKGKEEKFERGAKKVDIKKRCLNHLLHISVPDQNPARWTQGSS